MKTQACEVMTADVPVWMAIRVARVKHARECTGFDANRNRAAPPLQSREHHQVDLLRARMTVADMCNALNITPEELSRLWRYHNQGVEP